MKTVKKTVSSRKISVNGFEISVVADVSAFAHMGGFVFSLAPVLVVIETESEKYSCELKRKGIENPV